MKVNIIELRDMIAAAVRQTVAEAKKPKLAAPRSEESISAERDRRLTGLPGYAHGDVLDMSKPLGRKNLAKRQGNANMGGWTSEGRIVEGPDVAPIKREFHRKIIDLLNKHPDMRNELYDLMHVFLRLVDLTGPQKYSRVNPEDHGLDDPSELDMVEQQREAVRLLVRRIVAEEIRVRRQSR